MYCNLCPGNGVADELISDWFADRFGIDQRALLRTGWKP
jgi:hypothetical protein